MADQREIVTRYAGSNRATAHVKVGFICSFAVRLSELAPLSGPGSIHKRLIVSERLIKDLRR
jgi:hypothetical protein